MYIESLETFPFKSVFLFLYTCWYLILARVGFLMIRLRLVSSSSLPHDVTIKCKSNLYGMDIENQTLNYLFFESSGIAKKIHQNAIFHQYTNKVLHMWLHKQPKKHRNELIKLTNIHIRLSKASNDDKDDEVRFYHMFFAHKGKVKWHTGWFMTSHAVYRRSQHCIGWALLYPTTLNFVCAEKAHDRQLSLAPVYTKKNLVKT